VHLWVELEHELRVRYIPEPQCYISGVVHLHDCLHKLFSSMYKGWPRKATLPPGPPPVTAFTTVYHSDVFPRTFICEELSSRRLTELC
jgi:hypothetical protein